MIQRTSEPPHCEQPQYMRTLRIETYRSSLSKHLPTPASTQCDFRRKLRQFRSTDRQPLQSTPKQSCCGA